MSNDSDWKYLPALAAAAPAFAVKPWISDLPKASLEYGIEQKLRKRPKGLGKLLQEGAGSRGLGRAVGSAAGVLTAPFFLRGIQLASSDKKSDQAKGMALLGSSAVGYGALKGGFEGTIEARRAGKESVRSALGKGFALGGTRSLVKLPPALALGAGIAAGRKRAKNKKGSGIDKFLIPALTGAGVGALNRGVEGFSVDAASKGWKKALNPRLRLSSMAGGAAGGLLGGALLAGITDYAMKSMKKEGALRNRFEKTADPVTAALVGAGGLAALLGARVGARAAVRGSAARRFAVEGPKGLSSTQRAMSSGLSDSLATGIREGVRGRKGLRYDVRLDPFAPAEIKNARKAGISIGQQLRSLPPEKREAALKLMAGKLRNSPGYKKRMRAYAEGGDLAPLIRDLPKGLETAAGAAPFGTPKWVRALGVPHYTLGAGLPKAKKPGVIGPVSQAAALKKLRASDPDGLMALIASDPSSKKYLAGLSSKKDFSKLERRGLLERFNPERGTDRQLGALARDLQRELPLPL